MQGLIFISVLSFISIGVLSYFIKAIAVDAFIEKGAGYYAILAFWIGVLFLQVFLTVTFLLKGV